MINSRNQRMSMIGLALASPSVMANPDGAIRVADRAQLLWLYAMIRYARVDDMIISHPPVQIDFIDIEEEKIIFT